MEYRPGFTGLKQFPIKVSHVQIFANTQMRNIFISGYAMYKSMKKLIVSGPRTCRKFSTVSSEIGKFIEEMNGVDEIVAGGSTGVDLIAKQYAQDNKIAYKEFQPDWQDDLNAAGFVRDARMTEYGTHLLILSNGGSKESKNLIAEAKKNNLTIKTVGYIEEMLIEMKQPVGTPAGSF